MLKLINEINADPQWYVYEVTNLHLPPDYQEYRITVHRPNATVIEMSWITVSNTYKSDGSLQTWEDIKRLYDK